MNEPQDICCICGATGPDGSMSDVNDEDFELLCEDCKGKRCTGCNFLRSKMKFNSPRYFCRHRGCIEDPKRKVCDWFEEQDAAYSTESTYSDYS